jgi:O-Antigen ligase.
MKISVGRLNKYILVALILFFPILPEYFRLGGYPVYQYIVLIAVLITTISGIGKQKLLFFIKKIWLFVVVIIIAYGSHGEWFSMIAYIISSCLLFWSVFFLIKNKKTVEYLYRILIIMGFILCITGIIEKVIEYNVFSIIENTDLGLMGTAPYYRNGVIRIEQSFGTSITYGIYLNFINTLSLGKYTIAEKRKKTFYLLTYLLTFIAVFFSNSRMVLITLVLLQITYFFRINWSKKIVFISVILSGGIIDALNGSKILKKLEEYIFIIVDIFLATNSSQITDITSAYRFQLVETLWPYIKQNFWFGYGNEYMSQFSFSMFGYKYYSIDNALLNALMRYGFFGIVLLLLPIGYGMVLAIRKIIRKEKMGYFLLLSFLMYFINLTSVAQMSEQRIFYTILALMLTEEWQRLKDRKGEYIIIDE